ncbi:MAG: hypothetical protein KKH29_02295 [Candidatus Omnitrophica bacterium]|nr:hypothetical protein [Candidatus Omnitrophota bacterium]MBU4473589.1 hypothetical protein [Candidatus Omnitrophota bacterium]MCG2706306.1 hypothetical protein [Candidatus Omnitrophota bacterium]
MKLFKFLTIITFITLFSLAFVWQQTEIFRLAYLGQKKLNVFQDLLDNNALLRYNTERDASLIRIAGKVSEYSDFQMPYAYHLVRLRQPKEALRVNGQLSQKENIISRLFDIKRQAEAKTISPSTLPPSISSEYFYLED